MRLLDHLPSGSAYWAARADDDELAQEIASKPGAASGTKRTAPPLAEMSLSNQLTMTMVDLLTVMVNRIEIQLGAKPAAPKPMDRPETALQRAQSLLERTRHTDLVAEAYAAQARQATMEQDN